MFWHLQCVLRGIHKYLMIEHRNNLKVVVHDFRTPLMFEIFSATFLYTAYIIPYISYIMFIIVTCRVVLVTRMMGSGSDDWIY
jgi:hypothetical protein